jgi:hypothetical protein
MTGSSIRKLRLLAARLDRDPPPRLDDAVGDRGQPGARSDLLVVKNGSKMRCSSRAGSEPVSAK